MLNLRVADHVRYQSQDHGGVVILDIADGKWLALNATAGDFWRAWDAGDGFEEGLRAAEARNPNVSRGVLRADAERLRSDLVHRGLLKPANGKSAFTRARGPKPVTATASSGGGAVMAVSADAGPQPERRGGRTGLALCALVTAGLIVHCASFRIQFALVQMTRRWCRETIAPEKAAALVAAVDWAVSRYPGRAACLERSLAAVLLAAAAGRRLDWCVGAVPDPYRFHAWVEAGDHPVPTRDDPPPSLGYVRLLSA